MMSTNLRKSLLAIALGVMVGSLQGTLAATPAPTTVSPIMGAAVSAEVGPVWGSDPKTLEDWVQIRDSVDGPSTKAMPALAEQYHVDVREDKIAGVPVYWLTPKQDAPGYDPKKLDKLVLYLHGGGYILGHGLASIREGLPLAGWEGYPVLCVDYRLAPEFPFPAAIDDAFAVYKEIIKDHKPQDIAVFGSSTGGAMTLILQLQALQANVPAPGALIAGSPWSELGKKGDTYTTHAGLDNILGTYDHLLKHAAEVYANGADMSQPLLSPVNAADADLARFPPTLLISGTRDLFLSNTVRMHERLRLNHAPAELMVYEAQSHVQYYLVPNAPEAKTHYQFLNEFLDRTIGASAK